MPGHIFDANTLRNFALVGQLSLLPSICPGNLYRSGIVKDELQKGPAGFYREHATSIALGETVRVDQFTRFQALDTTLQALGMIDIRVTGTAAHATTMALFGYCIDVEWMDEGEAESLALAATRNYHFYTDDFQAKELVLKYNDGLFRYPPLGVQATLYRPIPVHSTAWLLNRGVEQHLITREAAEHYFYEMRGIWGGHPQLTLLQLEEGPPLRYW